MAEATLFAALPVNNTGKCKPKKFDVDPKWFHQKYAVELVPTYLLAAEIGCVNEHVNFLARKFGIPIRPRLPKAKKVVRVQLDMARAAWLYEIMRMNCRDIGQELGVNGSTIGKRLRAAGVAIRHHNDTKRGAKARNRIELDAKKVIKLYLTRFESGQTVADHFGVERGVIDRILRENKIPKKPMSETRNFWGEKSPNWRADLTEEDRAKRRDMYQQAEWRAKVYARDNFTCQKCGDDEGGNLNAHHIEPHCRNREAAWDVNNGITLCAPCHRAFHSRYGLKRCTRADLNEYIEISA